MHFYRKNYFMLFTLKIIFDAFYYKNNFQFWRWEKCLVHLYCNYSQVHSDPEN